MQSTIRELLEMSDVDQSIIDTLPPQFETDLMDRITDEVAANLTTDKLADLSNIVTTSHNPDALRIWLTANVPNLSVIVREETDILLGDYAANAQ